MIMMMPYIGITGFTAASEVSAVLDGWPEPAASASGRRLMCGALLSNALLEGRRSNAPNRCPAPAAIAGIFAADARCLNLVHYRPRAGADLADALALATDIGGANCHGVQINATRGAPWPEPDALAEYRRRAEPERIVLQVGREAMAGGGNDPAVIAGRCAEYAGIVTDILVDASEGLGCPLDAAVTGQYLDAIAQAAPSLGLVVAGGLYAGNIAALLSPLLPAWGAVVSIDAEGRLRDDADRLDTGAAREYLRAARLLLGAGDC